jgi:hypothetical protein
MLVNQSQKLRFLTIGLQICSIFRPHAILKAR